MFLKKPLTKLKFFKPSEPWYRYFLLAILLIFFTAWQQQKTDRTQLDSLLELVDRHIDVYALDSPATALEKALNRAFLLEDEFEVPLSEYLSGLLDHHREIFQLENSRTQITLNCPTSIILPVNQILNLSIILNEWLNNTKKHAFRHTEKPQINILIREENGMLDLDYRDNGSGMEPRHAAGTGTGLIEKFAHDLDAKLSTENDGGIHHSIGFKIQLKKTKTQL